VKSNEDLENKKEADKKVTKIGELKKLKRRNCQEKNHPGSITILED